MILLIVMTNTVSTQNDTLEFSIFTHFIWEKSSVSGLDVNKCLEGVKYTISLDVQK